MTQPTDFDVIVLGAGAAGLMCAMTAGKRGKKVLVIDHNEKIGEKIRISGGGRCNFTNIASIPKNFLSENPRFCISALKRYRPQSFIDLVDSHQIAWHDKGQGQLFCDGSAAGIVTMLLEECHRAGVKVWKGTSAGTVEKAGEKFHLLSDKGPVGAHSLVVATGGLSIPKIGASGFGHMLAQQFGHKVVTPKPGLVPLTFSGDLLNDIKSITGLSVNAVIKFQKTTFSEALLFTHRGLSGPAILQISSYWQEGLPLSIDLLPGKDVFAELSEARNIKGKQQINNVLSGYLPARLAEFVCKRAGVSGRLADLNNKLLRKVAEGVNNWQVLPQGTEGYRTAEVTLGGVDTSEISSKTMQSNKVSNLYFVGEVMDVTGQLGGHNFQWAWASGHAAGESV
jgi:predicted Rossmann fold flavoprotein